ncbi:hypothetical protein BC629DRAFT_1482011 [Irpex lacteus]|nr:hypothetical protein BC629DRAFT_1482011 [Irpex lacteus]
MPTYPCFIGFWQATQLLDSVVRGPVLIETMLWGLFSCLLILSTFLWIQDSPHSIVRVYMISVCVTMYAAATAHWVVMFDWLQKTSSLQEEFLLNSIQHSAIAALCPTPQEFNPDSPLFFNLPVLPSCAPTAFLSVNVILSDALVLYRARVIWPRNIVVQLVSSLLFLWLLEKSAECNFCNSNGVPVIGVSFILNLWATFLIGYKAWEHKQVIKSYLTKGNTRTRSEKVLGLLIDTGLLYSALWVIVLAGTFSNSPGHVSDHLGIHGHIRKVAKGCSQRRAIHSHAHAKCTLCAHAIGDAVRPRKLSRCLHAGARYAIRRMHKLTDVATLPGFPIHQNLASVLEMYTLFLGSIIIINNLVHRIAVGRWQIITTVSSLVYVIAMSVDSAHL